MSLIVNADDFGKSEDVNRAIKECFEKGYINRTTLMANMPGALKATEIANQCGFMEKVGLHINLTEGRPLTEGIAKNPDFCDENGMFNAAFYRSTIKRLYMDKKSVNDIYCEIKAQFDKYHELGFALNHIDSHHHVHTNYPVLKALKMLSKEYSFSSIRLSRNLYRGGSLLNRVYKKIYNIMIKSLCSEVTDYFGSFVDAKNYFSCEKNGEQSTVSTDSIDIARENLADFIKKNSLEIMVHPMYSEDGILVDTEIPFEDEILLYEVK